MGGKNQVAPAPAPDSGKSSSEYGSDYESSTAASSSGFSSSEASSTAPTSAPSFKKADQRLKKAAKLATLGHAHSKTQDGGARVLGQAIEVEEPEFVALLAIKSCERCSQPQTRTRVLDRCAACEQAICGDCNAVSVSAFPGSTLCLDCLDEHGEGVVEVDAETGLEITDSPAAMGETGGSSQFSGNGAEEAPLMTGYTIDGQAISVPAEVGRLFSELDADGSGGLNKAELEKLAGRLGVALSDADLDAAMLEMDPSGDG